MNTSLLLQVGAAEQTDGGHVRRWEEQEGENEGAGVESAEAGAAAEGAGEQAEAEVGGLIRRFGRRERRSTRSPQGGWRRRGRRGRRLLGRMLLRRSIGRGAHEVEELGEGACVWVA